MVTRLERQLTTLKTQMETLIETKVKLEKLLAEKETLLIAARAERDEALVEKFQLLRESNERSTSAASSFSRPSDVSSSHLEEQLFKARAEKCQLQASLEDCLFERNEAQRLLHVRSRQIRDEEIKKLTVWMEKQRIVAQRTLGTNRGGDTSARGRDLQLTFLGK